MRRHRVTLLNECLSVALALTITGGLFAALCYGLGVL